MFSTRLNPTKPPAAHRAILERVGAACRELRPIEDECWARGQTNDQTKPIFDKHGVTTIGVAVDQGGAGDDPLLVALAAERIGREGLRLVRWFADHVASRADGDVIGMPNDEGGVSSNDPAESLFRFRLNLSFCWAAGRIGVLADCLETIAAFCAERIQAGGDATNTSAIERMVAQLAADLEATRAVTYAAAELKAELYRHPHSQHLRLEAGTLVAEAYHVSARSVAQMFEQARLLAATGQPLVGCLPLRHRSFADSGDLRAEPDEWVESQIARYYLFE